MSKPRVECPDCPGVTFSNRQGLYRHRCTKHDRDKLKFACTLEGCTQRFFDNRTLQGHIPQCQKRTVEVRKATESRGTVKQMTEEERKEYDTERHSVYQQEWRAGLDSPSVPPDREDCPHCGKDYAKSSLKEHIDTQHGGADKPSCPICNKQMARQNIKSHIEAQHGEYFTRPFLCRFTDQGCHFRFLDDDSRAEHEEICASRGDRRKVIFPKEVREQMTEEEREQNKKDIRRSYYAQPEIKEHNNEQRRQQRHELKTTDPEAWEVLRAREREQERARSQSDQHKATKREWRRTHREECRGYWKKYMAKPETRAKKSKYWGSDHYKVLKKAYMQIHPRSKEVLQMYSVERMQRALGARSELCPFFGALPQEIRKEFVAHFIGKPCVYCGCEPADGIDRLNPRLPYQPGNAVPACTCCNLLKGSFLPGELLERCDEILTYQHQDEGTNSDSEEDDEEEAIDVIHRSNLLYSLVAHAKHLNLPCEMKEEDLLFYDQPTTRCSYCGCQRTEEVLGVDRLDSSLGYIKGNCVAACGSCNFMKRQLSPEDFLSQVSMIYEKLTEMCCSQKEVDLDQILCQYSMDCCQPLLSNPTDLSNSAKTPTYSIAITGDGQEVSTKVFSVHPSNTYHNEGCIKLFDMGGLPRPLKNSVEEMSWKLACLKGRVPCAVCRTVIFPEEAKVVAPQNNAVANAKRGLKRRLKPSEDDNSARIDLWNSLMRDIQDQVVWTNPATKLFHFDSTCCARPDTLFVQMSVAEAQERQYSGCCRCTGAVSPNDEEKKVRDAHRHVSVIPDPERFAAQQEQNRENQRRFRQNHLEQQRERERERKQRARAKAKQK